MRQWYQVTVPNNGLYGVRWSDYYDWCSQTFGNNSLVWNYSGGGRFNFSDEQSKMLFLLKWA